MKLSVVIPCYNEVEHARDAGAKGQGGALPAEGDHRRRRLLDRRHARAAHRAAACPASTGVIYHDQNQGKGAALRTGIAAATGDVVVVQDADLEYDPQRIREADRADPRRQGRRRLRLALPRDGPASRALFLAPRRQWRC